MTPDMHRLDLLLDVVLPGDADYPAASGIGLAKRLAAHDRFGPTSAAAVAFLPADFAALDRGSKTAAVKEIEAREPQAFAAFITGVYSLYYSDPAVLAAIARTTGYTPHSPQPEGYALDPFDPDILKTVAGRARQYRDIGDR